MIAVNQDPLGIQGKMLFTERAIEVELCFRIRFSLNFYIINEFSFQIWSRPIKPVNALGEYSYAVAFVSRRADGHARSILTLLSDMDLKSSNGYKVKVGSLRN